MILVNTGSNCCKGAFYSFTRGTFDSKFIISLKLGILTYSQYQNPSWQSPEESQAWELTFKPRGFLQEALMEVIVGVTAPSEVAQVNIHRFSYELLPLWSFSFSNYLGTLETPFYLSSGAMPQVPRYAVVKRKFHIHATLK